MADPLKILVIGARRRRSRADAKGCGRPASAVEVYERDAVARVAARRLPAQHQPDRRRGAEACLPTQLYDRFTRETARPARSVTFLDHHFERCSLSDCRRPTAIRRTRSARSRAWRFGAFFSTVSEEIVHFGKRLVACEADEHGATAHFEDGDTVRGDLIVGADGANSPTRAHLLPGTARQDLGILAFGGKVPLNSASAMRVRQPIFSGPTLVMGPRGRFMFASAIEYDDLVDGAEREQYAMWGVSAPRHQLPLPADVQALDARAVRAAALTIVSGWDPRLRRLVEAADLAR